VSIALWRIPTMRTPDMTTNRWHSHHTSCAVIGSYKPCRHSIVEVNFTIIAAEEPVLARQFDDNVDMRHLIEKYTPRMSCISQSEERDGKFEFTVDPRICNANYMNTTGQSAGSEREFLRMAISHTSLVGAFP
jgi:hypothetical protein